jgi:hypothetical protein
MSVAAMAWAWQQELELPSIKLVLLALASHATKAGYCQPEIGSLCAMTGLSQPTIWRAMGQLTTMGLVQQVPKGRSYSYALNLTNTIQRECNTPTNTIQIDSKPKHRLSVEWQPNDNLLLWAQERAPHVDTTLETERFIDHFCHVKPDRRTTAGWDASWRAWLLRARRDYKPAAIPFPTRSQRTSQRNAAIVGDALAGRTTSASSVRDSAALPLRLIEGGKNGADGTPPRI